MNHLPQVFLKHGRDKSLNRFHLWVFSGAIKNITGHPDEGDVVEVYSSEGEYLATGHFQRGSIMVRIFSFKQTDAGEDFWMSKIGDAIRFRQGLGFFDNPETNAFRIIHGEGDGMPGLVVDFYNGVVVFQAHSVGMFRMRDTITNVIKNLLHEKVVAIYDKSESTLNMAGEEQDGNRFLFGNRADVQVNEFGYKFDIDIKEGQKTGFFIDQRENRRLLKEYCNGKKVANIFGYTGGFSVYAAGGGAVLVDTIDSSDKAVTMARRNMELNFSKSDNHRFFDEDAFAFLKKREDLYDVIVLDPPAFAKHREAQDNALKAYRRINEAAFNRLGKGGILFTFSCSQVVTREDFRTAVFSAAAVTGRNVRILHQLTQPADHPVNIFHPEGEYLKGLVLYVD